MLIVVPDPPQAGGVMAEPDIGKQKPKPNAGTVTRRAKRRESTRRSTPIRRKPDLDPDTDQPNKEIASGRTTPKDLKKLERG